MENPAYEALNFIGKNISDLNMKDYIAAQHLVRIIDEIEVAIASLSIKAYTNVLISEDIEKDPNNCEKEFAKLDKEMYIYEMYIERLTSHAYRNLISKKAFESKINNELMLDAIFKTNMNITKDEYLNMDEDRKAHYMYALARLSRVYRFDDDPIKVQIHKLYDSVATIASLSFAEQLILKYSPFKKLTLRKK